MNNNNTGIDSPFSQASPLGYKLEIGKHTFKDRILENCVYVDKTRYIYELISRDSNVFLSRPRRFGKSLLISTLKELFSGSKELFKNCWIYDKIEWQEYPIIHLDFITVDYKTLGLEQAIDESLNRLATNHNIEFTRKSIKGKFDELIESLAQNKKVVVLIDEYDKPIIDYIDNFAEAVKNRDILKNFYSVLKAQAHNIKFLFITGVSKFSQVSIFSDLLHIKDITLHPRYSRMLGYTLEEIETYFPVYISEWEKQNGQERQVLFEKLKDYYNGYSWDGVHFVFNPSAILNFLDTFLFNDYWFATGTPTFLVKKIKNFDDFVDLYDRYEVDKSFFEKYKIDNIDTIDISALLFQTGYLTIKEKIGQKYILSYPNQGVKNALFENLLDGFTSNSQGYWRRGKIRNK